MPSWGRTSNPQEAVLCLTVEDVGPWVHTHTHTHTHTQHTHEHTHTNTHYTDANTKSKACTNMVIPTQ